MPTPLNGRTDPFLRILAHRPAGSTGGWLPGEGARAPPLHLLSHRGPTDQDPRRPRPRRRRPSGRRAHPAAPTQSCARRACECSAAACSGGSGRRRGRGCCGGRVRGAGRKARICCLLRGRAATVTAVTARTRKYPRVLAPRQRARLQLCECHPPRFAERALYLL